MIKLSQKETAAINEYLAEIKIRFSKNISEIKLYGSKAKGYATEESDIDILLILKALSDRSTIIRFLSQIESELNIRYGVLISTYPVEEKYYIENKNLPFIHEVDQYSINL